MPGFFPCQMLELTPTLEFLVYYRISCKDNIMRARAPGKVKVTSHAYGDKQQIQYVERDHPVAGMSCFMLDTAGISAHDDEHEERAFAGYYCCPDRFIDRWIRANLNRNR